MAARAPGTALVSLPRRPWQHPLSTVSTSPGRSPASTSATTAPPGTHSALCATTHRAPAPGQRAASFSLIHLYINKLYRRATPSLSNVIYCKGAVAHSFAFALRTLITWKNLPRRLRQTFPAHCTPQQSPFIPRHYNSQTACFPGMCYARQSRGQGGRAHSQAPQP